MNNLVLSICIPTFNRKSEIVHKIKELLVSQNSLFDVVVLDNCSTDGTFESLSELNDDRLKIYRNDKNIGGILNPLKVITYGDGEYSILVLDKDFLDIGYIDSFIQFLTLNEYSHGFCELNCSEEKNNYIFEDIESSLKRTSFLSKHPSGMFWRTELYKDSKTLKKIFLNNKVFGFYFELINSEMAFNANKKSCIYNHPLIFTEKVDVSVVNKTNTYNKKNIFFNPLNRKKEYIKYITHANNLCNEKKLIIFIHRLLVRRFISSLINSNKLRNDKYHLEHYVIGKKDIPFYTFFISFFSFIHWYFSSNNKINLSLKFWIFLTILCK